MANSNPYEFWERALAGEKVGGDTLPVHEGQVEMGFWRKRVGKTGPFVPVAIWQDGGLICTVDGKPDNADEVFSYCCRHPISEQQYRDRVATGKWWDEDDSVTASLSSPSAGHNQPDAVDSIKDQIASALAGIGAYTEVKDDEQAAKAQSLRSRLLELSREADKQREALKRPHLEAGKAVDELYQPLAKSAKIGADTIAKALSAHETAKFRAEQARLAAEQAAEAKEAAKHAPIGAEPELPPAPAPLPLKTGLIKGAYGRGASRKVVKTAVVRDQDAAYAHFKAQPELVGVIHMLAQRSVTAGFAVPGVETTEEVRVS